MEQAKSQWFMLGLVPILGHVKHVHKIRYVMYSLWTNQTNIQISIEYK